MVTKKESESMEDAFWFMVGAYNPVGFLDFGSYGTSRGIAQKAVGLGSLYAVVHGASALSGGGATPQRIRDVAKVTWRTVPAIKADSVRAAAQVARRAAMMAARGAVRSTPLFGVVAAVYAMSEASTAYWEHLASLDWVPDLYHNPLR